MTGKTSLYCVTVMISCEANIEDAAMLFFCCVSSLLLLLSESFALLSFALEMNFSNSLIIHELMTQSARINWVRCMYVDTQ